MSWDIEGWYMTPTHGGTLQLKIDVWIGRHRLYGSMVRAFDQLAVTIS